MKDQNTNTYEEAIGIEELNSLIRLEWDKAERAKQLMVRNASLTGKQPSQLELDRAAMPYEKMAEAYQMILTEIVKRKIKNSAGADMAEKLQLFHGEETSSGITITKPVQKHPKEAPVNPEIKDKGIQKKADEIIANADIEDSIYEAVKLADGKKSSEHWEVARNKVIHFYRGTDELSSEPDDKEIDEFIKKISDKVKEKLQKSFEESIGISRASAKPITDIKVLSNLPLSEKGHFNFEVLTGVKNPESVEETEDEVKLMIINEFTKGNKSKAVSIARNYYENKGWENFEAEEFVFTLMKKEPHKELSRVIKGVLESNKNTKGDPKKGIKLCRTILGSYFGKRYVNPKSNKGNPITLKPEEKRNNELIDRFINRELQKLNPKS